MHHGDRRIPVQQVGSAAAERAGGDGGIPPPGRSLPDPHLRLAPPRPPDADLLRAELFPESSPMPTSPNTNLFRYKTDRPAPASPFASSDGKIDCGMGSPSPAGKKGPRKVRKTPHKVLDVPSSQNMLAVGLGTCVYLWSASSSKVTKLCDLGPRDSACAVHWTREGSYLAIGTSLGDVQIWDSSRCKRIRNMGGHQTRARVLALNSTILSSGSRDKNILQHDIRVPSDYISKFSGHKSEIWAEMVP